MKFLIIRLSSIGDVVLSTPVIRCLKTQVPNAEIHFLVASKYREVLAANPYLHSIHVVERLNYGLIDELRKENFDALIDLQDDEDTRHIRALLDVQTHTLRQRDFQKTVLTRFKINLFPAHEHTVDRYLHAVTSFGVRNDGQGLDYFIPRDQEITEKDIPASHHLGFIALVIGASFRTKKLPVAKLRELCEKIDHPIILLGGLAESHEGAQISTADPVKIYNACGKFSLHESADLLRRSKLVVSHDTGLMHIAAALKKQVIAVWGSTVPALGMTPYYGNRQPQPGKSFFQNVQVKGLWCRPCTTVGRNECPLGHFKCMRKIDLSELLVKIRTGLKNEGW